MKKYVFAVFAAIAGVIVSLSFTSSAQAYPDVRIDLGVNHPVLYGGETFRATAKSNVDCSWNQAWNGSVREGTGTTYVASYTAPEVNRITKIALTGICTYAAPTAAGAKASAASGTWTRKITVTVLPRANGAAAPSDARSDLPGAGGPNLAVLLSGLGLLLAGATAVTVARRRAEEVELPGQTA